MKTDINCNICGEKKDLKEDSNRNPYLECNCSRTFPNDLGSIKMYNNHFAMLSKAKYVLIDPEYEDIRRRGQWVAPELEDLIDLYGFEAETWDSLTESQQKKVGRHFVLSQGSFPPENYTDLKIPVVDKAGNLVKNGVHNAKARVNQVKGISEEMLEKAEAKLNDLWKEIEKKQKKLDADQKEEQEEKGQEKKETDLWDKILETVS